MTAVRWRVDPVKPDPTLLEEAAAVLRDGGIVAFPTETVYGLGALYSHPAAVERVFRAKGRPADRPLSLHLGAREDAAALVRRIPPQAHRLMNRFWPGPLAIILSRAPAVPDIVAAGGPTVSLRLPAHAVARGLSRAAGGALAAPSANLSGRPSPTTAEHVLADLGDAIDGVVDAGPTPVGLESTVIDLTQKPPVVLRRGSVPVRDIEAVIGPVRRREADVSLRLRVPVVLVEGRAADPCRQVAAACRRLSDHGLRVGLLARSEMVAAVTALAPGALVTGPAPAAGDEGRGLYAGIRDLEGRSDVIIVPVESESPPMAEGGRDRLTQLATLHLTPDNDQAEVIEQWLKTLG